MIKIKKNSKFFKNKNKKMFTILIHHHKLITRNITKNKKCIKLQKIDKVNK